MHVKKGSSYIIGLDSLRAIACLSVVFFHSNYITKSHSYLAPFKGGYFGVDLFFVLSGYLITSILVNQFVNKSTINFKRFYINRALRLYPPIIISIVIFLIPLLLVDKLTAIANIVSLMTYTGDCFMVVQYFTHLPYPLLTGHSWSLSVEEQFYILYPLLLLIVLRYSIKRSFNLISTFPIYLLFYFLIVIVSTIVLKQWFYKFFLWRFFEIYLGAYISIIYSRTYNQISIKTAISAKIRKIAQEIFKSRTVLIIAILFTFCMLIYPSVFSFINMGKYNLHCIFFTFSSSILIVNLVESYNPIFTSLMENSLLAYVGKISYGLYLYHPFIWHKVSDLYFKGNPFQNSKTMIVSDISSLLLSLIFSILSYELVEKKLLKLKFSH